MALDIICVTSVTHGEEVFSRLGRVRMVDDAAVDANLVRGADVLVTRSKTRLGPELLAGSGVKFAGTATAGVDHADIPWLQDQGIRFAAAPGCNANSVGEYVCAGLVELSQTAGLRLAGARLGIVGHGHVGKNVEAKARALGMEVLLNDPPLRDETGDLRYLELDEVCAKADFLTLHVPLVEDGPYPTRKLIGPALHLKPGAMLINACRGEVVDSSWLEQGLDSGAPAAAVLDVWDPEPAFPVDLLRRAHIGTAHIAGYSFEGKFNGTLQVYDAACAFFETPGERAGLERQFRAADSINVPAGELEQLDDEAAIAHCLRNAYDIRVDDRLLREIAADTDRLRGERFMKLRKQYRRRDEFPSVSVALPPGRDGLGGALRALGFAIRS